MVWTTWGGIPDVSLAMQEDIPQLRMRLPFSGMLGGHRTAQYEKYSDEMEIETQLGVGTKITMKVKI